MTAPDGRQQAPVDIAETAPAGPIRAPSQASVLLRQLWRPAVVIRVTAGFAAVGVLVGLVWALLAPPAHGAVALPREGDRVFVYLGNDSDQLFVAAALMIGLLTAVGVVAAVALWQWRPHRGPAMVVAATIGSVAAAAAATGVGAAVARLRWGAIDIAGAPVTPDDRFHYVVEAPPVFLGHSPWAIAGTLLAGAAAYAAVYAVYAAATERDDLGGYPPVETPRFPHWAPAAPSPATAPYPPIAPEAPRADGV